MLRHIYLTDKYSEVKEEQKNDSDFMSHSLGTQKTYIVKQMGEIVEKTLRKQSYLLQYKTKIDRIKLNIYKKYQEKEEISRKRIKKRGFYRKKL